MAQISPARLAAFSILMKVERGSAHADDLLRGHELSALSAQDRNLATALVLGVLRWQLWLDQVMQAHLSRPRAKLDREVSIALRLGAFQLLHLDRIPARAAIDESVELTKQAGRRFASGMVNAVLRKVAAQPAKTTEGSAEVTAYPAWMVDRWRASFGEEQTCTICRFGQQQPATTLRIQDEQTGAELVRAGMQMEPGEMLTRARLLLSGDVAATDAFRQGRVRIQDEGSQLIAEIAGTGSAILDCCAAPGGKTMILAERNPDAGIVAWEASAPRLAAMRERFDAQDVRAELRRQDATLLSESDQYDVVLADVPCSGTGTLARNPEIRYRLQPDAFARHADRQIAILKSALHAAKPGGRVVYSTCSLEPEENEQVVAAVLKGETHLLPFAGRIDEMLRDGVITAAGANKLLECITPEGYLRLFPGQLGTDGFFVAMLQKQ